MNRHALRRCLTPCVAAIILALILTPVVDLFVRRMQEQSALNTVQVAGAAVTEAIDRWYDERVKDLELLSKQPVLRSGDLPLIQSVLTDFQHKDQAIQVCVFFARDGRVLTSSAVPPGETNISSTPWFQSAVRGSTSVSSVHVSPITGRNVITILTPVRGTDGSVINVVGSVIELMSLQYAVEDSALASAGQPYLLDPAGQIVELGHFGGKPTTLAGRLESDATRQLASGKSGSGTYRGLAENDVCGCYMTLQMPGWGAIVGQDQAAVMRAMAPLRRTAAGASVAFSALVAVFGWLLVSGGRNPAPAKAEPTGDPPAGPAVPASGAGADTLSPREQEILRYVAGGLTNKEIANALFLSEYTVKTHLHRILSKLNLENRTQAAAYALRHLPPQ